MTRTGARLRRLATPHRRARALAVGLTAGGAALAAAAAGVALAPRLGAVLAAWVAIVAAAAGGVWWWGRVRRAAALPAMARLAERAAGARRGSVESLVGPAAAGSPDLLELADGRAEEALTGAAGPLGRLLGAETRRQLVWGLGAAAAGAALLLAAAPGRRAAAAFWNPVEAWRAARAPVRLTVDRDRVRRGDSVQVVVQVPGGSRANLWTRRRGEAWRSEALVLDSAGAARHTLGPLHADLFLRAASGSRESGVLRVIVEPAPFLADLTLTARFPAYLDRADEPLVPGPDTIAVPAGTAILASGAASVPLAAAAWRDEGGVRRGAALRIDGSRFAGRFAPLGDGVWRLALTPRGGVPLEGAAPELHVVLVPDAPPVVRIPVPGRDTTLPLSLRQPLVIDARDDYGLARLELVSWRVSRTGRRDEPVRLPLDVAGERAVVQTDLDLRDRGLLPGDTVRVLVEAFDHAPARRVGRSAVLTLRLPSMEELRAAARAATRVVGAAVESVAVAQSDLAARARDLATERARPTGPGAAQSPEPETRRGALPFEARERAEEVAGQQAEVSQRVAELAQAVEDIAQAARAAGVDDPSFQQRLTEVREMLERALTPELVQRLRALSEALAQLDPAATREALERLAQAQEQLRADLERSRDLFQRAAVEGALASLAADAEALREAQQRWNREEAPRADTAAAARQQELAALADSLARGIDQAGRDLREAGAPAGDPLAEPRDAARRAGEAMGEAAQGAARGDPRQARRAGGTAEAELADLPQSLRGRRDSLVTAWRAATLGVLDRALAETAALAERQEDAAAALEGGAADAGVRAQLGAVEEGAEAVGRQVREAASGHALVSPAVERALGFAQHQTRAARRQLEQSMPDAATAAALARQAVDALNVTVYALLRSRGAVANAQSGTGLEEAMEELTRLAGQQQGLNGDAQGLTPLLGPGGGAGLMQQLRVLAARQRALAQQLEWLQAGGESGAAGPLADEARELADEMDQGRFDRRTIERQERLYRRLLDAGRSLRGDDPDQRKERVARAATGAGERPAPAAPDARGVRAALRYPTWEELRGLTPEERRLVLEYFRRVNESR